jgi:hypothetical protein
MRLFWTPSELLGLPYTLPFQAPILFGKHPKQFVTSWLPKIDFIRSAE